MTVRKSLSTSFFVACLVTIGLAGFATACSHHQSAKDSTAGEPPKDWPQKMQRLSAVLTDLMPFVANSKKFSDPNNAAKIEQDTTELKSLAHQLKVGEMPNNDPSMKIVSQLFDEDVGRALVSLKSGNRDYARRILGDTTSYCIQCHTQTNNGPEFPHLSLDLQTKDLKPLDRAEFLAATRQFEPALKAYRQVLIEPDLAQSDSFAFEAAAREAMAISVRVHKDPKEALGLVKAVEANRALTPAFRKTVGAWKKSLEAWRKEKPKKLGKGEDPALHELNEAEALITSAQKADSSPLDDSQDITYFRAAGLLHDVLQRPQGQPARSDETMARALYLSGVASEATRDANFWGMHETYYEQCIQLRPLTEQAKQCYARLKDSILYGYSGSSGTQVPGEVQRRLDRYAALAFGPGGAPPSATTEGQ